MYKSIISHILSLPQETHTVMQNAALECTTTQVHTFTYTCIPHQCLVFYVKTWHSHLHLHRHHLQGVHLHHCLLVRCAPLHTLLLLEDICRKGRNKVGWRLSLSTMLHTLTWKCLLIPIILAPRTSGSPLQFFMCQYKWVFGAFSYRSSTQE